MRAFSEPAAFRPIALALALCGSAAAEESPPPAEAPAPEEEVEVASRTPLTTRDAPSIVSVVGHEEIERTGARDLLEILQLVPGFSFGVDVEGVVDVGFRGLWGHEGKVLFLLDGQELNETLYSTMQLGLHIPASIIERVEVIRGPGSAIYGGYAELAVVNIITRGPRDLNGPAGAVSYAQMNANTGRFTASASYGSTFAAVPGLGLSMHLAYGEGRRSDRPYTDFSGASYSSADNSAISDLLADLGLSYKGLKLRIIYDDYRVATREGVGPVEAQAWDQRFRSLFTELRWEARLHKMVTITPRISFKQQTPWEITDKSSDLFYTKTADRLLGGIQLTITPIPSLQIIAGGEGFWDHGRLNDPTLTGLQTLFYDSRTGMATANTIDFGNFAGYAQILWRNFIVNITVGARYEYNTQFGSSFVPRVALTKVLGRFHFKALYSRAFRAPGIENVNINPMIQPEVTDVVEAEVGVQLSGHVALTANGYWIRINKPIVYDFDQTTNTEIYLNRDHTGTAGAEAQFRMKYAWGFLNLGYSFYSSQGQNAVDLYNVPINGSVLLGMPAHKATIDGAVNLWRDHVTLGANVIVLSQQYGYTHGDGMGNAVIGFDGPTVLVNANLAYRNLGLRGLDLIAGVNNLLNEPYRVMQPYNGGHAPLPMGSREIYLRLAYAVPRS